MMQIEFYLLFFVLEGSRGRIETKLYLDTHTHEYIIHIDYTLKCIVRTLSEVMHTWWEASEPRDAWWEASEPAANVPQRANSCPKLPSWGLGAQNSFISNVVEKLVQSVVNSFLKVFQV